MASLLYFARLLFPTTVLAVVYGVEDPSMQMIRTDTCFGILCDCEIIES